MNVAQIYGIVNSVTGEILGSSAVVAEDLSNIVDIGKQLFDATSVDNYVKSLVNHIGRVIFVNRPYSGNVPNVLMDSWEYGSVLQKIRAELPVAQENKSWDLTDGVDYSPNVFRKPVVSSKFFNSRTTFEVQVSITERQVKESFSSVEQLNGFLSMVYSAVDRSMSIKVDALIMRTINAMMAGTIYADYAAAALDSKSGIKAVNLLYLYNQTFSPATALTPERALFDADFIKFASYTIMEYKDRLSKLSRLFNVGGTDKFTAGDFLHIVMLSRFVNAANFYLQSSTFHEMYTALPNAETVPYWQGSGTDYAFGEASKINVTIPLESGTTTSVTGTGILACMFDRDALGVTNMDRRVTTAYNAKAEFTNNFFKFDAGFFNDFNENFVIFFVA